MNVTTDINECVTFASIYHGVTPQPYWLSFLSPFVSTICSVFLNRRKLGSQSEIIKTVIGANSLIFGLHLIANSLQFIYLVCLIISKSFNESIGSNGWELYQEFYVHWTNSGALSTLATGVLDAILIENVANKQHDWIQTGWIFLFLSFLPVLFTHLFVMLIIYIWIMGIILGLGIMIINFLTNRLFKNSLYDTFLEEHRRHFGFFICAFIFKLTIIGAFIIVFQSFFNYAFMFWNKAKENRLDCYFCYFANEYEMRSTTCYLESLDVMLLLGSIW